MRTARDSVQGPDRKSRVRMRMRRFLIVAMPMAAAMHVHVHVRLPTVRMFMSVQMLRKSFAKSPQSDRHQRHSHQTFRPGRKRLDGHELAHEQRGQAYEQDATGVTNAPPRPSNPGANSPL